MGSLAGISCLNLLHQFRPFRPVPRLASLDRTVHKHPGHHVEYLGRRTVSGTVAVGTWTPTAKNGDRFVKDRERSHERRLFGRAKGKVP